jgi:hypothetical protein
MFAMTASTFVTRMARVGESEPTAIRDAWMRPAMVAAHAPREERMAKKEGPLTVAFAQYPDPDSAKDALQTLQQMEKEGAIDVVDAGVTEKQSDGKAKISDVQKHARRMNVGEGAIIGGVASLLFPPGIIAGAIVGGVAGEVVGRLRHHEAFKKGNEAGCRPDASRKLGYRRNYREQVARGARDCDGRVRKSHHAVA